MKTENNVNLYEIFSGDDLKTAERIQQLRLLMLVHSCIYYEMDQNVVSDKNWDAWAKELRKLQADYPEISKQVGWYEAFKDWDASSGAFLPLKDPWVIEKAHKILYRGAKPTKAKQRNK